MNAFRIVYVPGMKPKPEPALHRQALLRALSAGLARARPAAAELLGRQAERFELVSWTYRFYGSYRDLETDRPGMDRLLSTPQPSAEDLRQIESLRRRLLRWWHLLGDSRPWLGRLIARPDMRVLMNEVRRYLRNEDGVADDVRALAKAPLLRAWQADERVMLIGHSLGSVIAYDSLWELSRRQHTQGAIDLFMTLGSPLATRFIRKSLLGAEQPPPLSYPTNIRRWVNFSAKGELTALHPRLRPFFGGIVKAGLTESLEDHADIYSAFHADFGLNVHKSYGYLAHPAVADAVGAWLEQVA